MRTISREQTMAGMLVKLYSQRKEDNRDILAKEGITLRRALAIDKQPIVNFISSQFNDICSGWVDECVATLYRQPTTCFIAIEYKKVIGFACFDATAKGMVGPIGVHDSYRNKGIAKALKPPCSAVFMV